MVTTVSNCRLKFHTGLVAFYYNGLAFHPIPTVPSRVVDVVLQWANANYNKPPSMTLHPGPQRTEETTGEALQPLNNHNEQKDTSPLMKIYKVIVPLQFTSH